MFRSFVLCCVYKNIVKIPRDFIKKSNFIHEYELVFNNSVSNSKRTSDNDKLNINILFESIINSNINYFSPFDSALFFHSLDLLYNKNQKVNVSNDKLYISARDLILRDLPRYRPELIPYFFDKLATVKDSYGLSTYLLSLNMSNINSIAPTLYGDIIYKIYKTLKHSESLSQRVKDSSFFKDIVKRLVFLSNVTPNTDQKNYINSQNVYKIIYGLAKLNYKNEESTAILKNLAQIDSDNWSYKNILNLAWSYYTFNILEKQLFYKIGILLMDNLDDLECKEIETIQEIYINDILRNDKILGLTRSRLSTLKRYGDISWGATPSNGHTTLIFLIMFSGDTDIFSIPPEFIISLAKTHGFMQSGKVHLQYAAARIIADTIEFRIKQVIQEASKFMYRDARPINRMTLTVDDIKCALKTLKLEDIFGYSNLTNHRYVCADKLYLGERVIKRECKLSSSVNNWGLCKLSELALAPMENRVPPIPSLKVDWLSVKGTIPMVSSHFGFDSTQQVVKFAEEVVELIDPTPKLDSILKDKPKTNENSLLKSMHNKIIANLSTAFANSMNFSLSRYLNSFNEPTTYIPKVEHILEKEHHFFLNCVKNAIIHAIQVGVVHSTQHRELDKVLHILSTSMALDQLMPELCYFFVKQMEFHMNNILPHAISILLSYAYSIISNPHSHIHFHIHQLMIPILQVALGKFDFPIVLAYQVLRVRRKAAMLIGQIVFLLKRSKTGLESMEAQLLSVIKDALSGEHLSIFTLYGAIACLSNLTPISRSLLLYPNVNSILSTLMYLSITTNLSIDIDYTESGLNEGGRECPGAAQLCKTKNILYNETIQILLGTLYYSMERDFLNTPDLFFSSCNAGYTPPYYQPNKRHLLYILDSFKLFMNGLLLDFFTPFLSAILRKLINHYDKQHNGYTDLAIAKLSQADLVIGSYIELTL